MKRFTLVLHSYMGYGSYFVHFKRVRCKPEMLGRYSERNDVHFIITGWPPIAYPGGEVAL